MNTINFTASGKFPLSTQALAFMQAMVQQLGIMSRIGGNDNYILTGCNNTTGTNYAAGYVVIAGELLPLVGGSGTTVKIVETKRSVTAGYDTYTDAYVSRHVEFGSNIGGANTFTWADFKRIKTNLELAAESASKTELTALSNLMMPKGGIIMWSGSLSAIPAGFALCDGSTVTSFGGAVPDLRGRFIVGVDPRITSSTVITNVTDLTLNYGIVGSTGGKPAVKLTGAESGTSEHDHNVPSDMGGDVTRFFRTEDTGNNNSQTYMKTGKSSAAPADEFHENRPPYYVLAFIIKVV